MKLTIKEIADMAGVSVTTVSQILNNKVILFS
ncbi:LacI family DNA-binding transcriptional regulator, partial [Enterococcus faecalis]